MVSLGVLNGGRYSRGHSVSADGNVVVGGAADGAAGNMGRAFRWTEATGIQSVEDWLRAAGVNVPADITYDARGVNADGSVVVGNLTSGFPFIARVRGSSHIGSAHFWGDSAHISPANSHTYGTADVIQSGAISGAAMIRSMNIIGQNWGIWHSSFGGTFIEPPPVNWTAVVRTGDHDNLSLGRISGTDWSNGKLAGTIIGGMADISSTPVTGITVGEVIGTFNPTAKTWQAAQTGAWLETRNFLGLAATEAGRTNLKQQQPNIPVVEIGRANLAGSGNNFTNLTMTDTIFFAPSTGAKPQIWATGNVSGSYTAAPALGTAIPLSGGGLSANFRFGTWDTTGNKWLSTITHGNAPSGIGSHPHSFTFEGVGAGTITPGAGTAGTISGTAAGIAQ